MLTKGRNDLVKAVAAVNKNVIVVGKFEIEHLAVALFNIILMHRVAHSVGPIILESILSNANVQAIVWAG